MATPLHFFFFIFFFFFFLKLNKAPKYNYPADYQFATLTRTQVHAMDPASNQFHGEAIKKVYSGSRDIVIQLNYIPVAVQHIPPVRTANNISFYTLFFTE